MVRMTVMLLVVLTGCPGSSTNTDGRVDTVASEGPLFPDGQPERGALDQRVDGLPDQNQPDGPKVDPCLAKTADGIPLNPGCDTDYQADGPTALGEFVDPATGKSSWLFVSKTKYWLYDPLASTTKGAFVGGGKDIGSAILGLEPKNCTTSTPGGMPLNPGCDVTFKANGPTSVGTIKTATSQGWLFTAGKKFWIFDPTSGSQGAFTAAGDNIGQTTMALSPTNCTTTATDGTPLNPGCDVGYQANGPTAWGEFTGTAGGVAWLFISGPKYWLFDPTASSGQGAFTGAGASIAQTLMLLSPGCSVTAADGTPLNPGCDVSIQANGPAAVGEFRQPGSASTAWLFTSGKKYWLYSPATQAFTAAGADIAAATRGL